MKLHFRTTRTLALAALALLSGLAVSSLPAAGPQGWLHWRGPQQHGVSQEKNLPTDLALGSPSHLWTVDIAGQSTAVIADGRLYIMSFVGEGPDLQERLVCLDAETGSLIWEKRFNDFLSDIIYTRYSTSNPTVDPKTGNIYIQGTQGIITGFTPKGEQLWEHSMMETFGRLTFPNGRTTSPVVEGDLVITHGITANWGGNGPASDRFYAFDTRSGDLVWFSTPAGRPKNSSYSPPTLAWWNGQRVFYCATGDGAIVCANALTGDPLWRVAINLTGANVDVLVHNNDKLITIHGVENIDTSEIGRMVAVRIPQELPPVPGPGPVIFDIKDLELWRNPLDSFSSSPILVGDTVYQVDGDGDLCAVSAVSGDILWKMDLGIEQRNASLVYADGHLYIPMLEDPDGKKEGGAGGAGAFYVIKPGPKEGRLISKVTLDGTCFGSPTVYNGKVYLQTTRKLYCFGRAGNNPGLPAMAESVKYPAAGPATQLQIIPPEVLMHPSEKVSFKIRKLDAKGFLVSEVEDPGQVQWASYIPPTAKVRVRMNGTFNKQGQLVASDEKVPSAGAYEATLDGLKGYIRGRVLPNLPIGADFEEFEITETHPATHPEPGVEFAYPPLPWIGARFKFEVREREGEKVLTKTIDNKLFQRGVVFIGDESMKNYTVEADVLSDGNRRKMSEVGLINQRYYIILKGNSRTLEVNSNQERIKVSVPFAWSPGGWYRLKTRVDVAPDGTGVVRAKAWKRGDPEPEAWTIEVPHKQAHAHGAPGLFGFAPQEMKVYIDNVSVTQN